MLSVSAAVVLGPICALLSVVMFGCGDKSSGVFLSGAYGLIHMIPITKKHFIDIETKSSFGSLLTRSPRKNNYEGGR